MRGPAGPTGTIDNINAVLEAVRDGASVDFDTLKKIEDLFASNPTIILEILEALAYYGVTTFQELLDLILLQASVSSYMIANYPPLEAPNGTRTVFTTVNTYAQDSLMVFLNGLHERFIINANGTTFQFTTPPLSTDSIRTSFKIDWGF